MADVLDRDKAEGLLARQSPWWEPGTAIGYQSITMGPLIGRVVRRVTGTTLGKFFAEEVARPLGGDFHIGTGPEVDARVSPLTARHPAAATRPARLDSGARVLPIHTSIPPREHGGMAPQGTGRQQRARQRARSRGHSNRGRLRR